MQRIPIIPGMSGNAKMRLMPGVTGNPRMRGMS